MSYAHASYSELSSCLHRLDHGLTESSWRPRHPYTRCFESCNFLLCSAFSSSYDRARVPHAASRRRCNASNERDDWLVCFVVFLQPLCCILFGLAADLADHDDAFCLRVVDESFQAVYEVRAIERIT